MYFLWHSYFNWKMWLLFHTKQVTFQWDNDDHVRFKLDHHVSWIFIVLAHCSNSTRVDMSLHSTTLSRFRAKQSLLLFLHSVCLTAKQQLPFYSLWFCPTEARTHDLCWHYTPQYEMYEWSIKLTIAAHDMYAYGQNQISLGNAFI